MRKIALFLAVAIVSIFFGGCYGGYYNRGWYSSYGPGYVPNSIVVQSPQQRMPTTVQVPVTTTTITVPMPDIPGTPVSPYGSGTTASASTAPRQTVIQIVQVQTPPPQPAYQPPVSYAPQPMYAPAPAYYGPPVSYAPPFGGTGTTVFGQPVTVPGFMPTVPYASYGPSYGYGGYPGYGGGYPMSGHMYGGGYPMSGHHHHGGYGVSLPFGIRFR